jgi:hypothetical protein
MEHHNHGAYSHDPKVQVLARFKARKGQGGLRIGTGRHLSNGGSARRRCHFHFAKPANQGGARNPLRAGFAVA